MKFIPIIITIATLSITTSITTRFIPATPVKAATRNFPQIRIIRNKTQIRIYDGKIITTIKADNLKARVLDSLTCKGKQVKRQTLSGKRFFPQAVKLDRKTGNLAVGVLLQNCSGQNISAAFILQPKPNWNNYVIHRVPVPGERKIFDRFSTYPLRLIKEIGFIDGDLLIKHADSTNSEALLVYSSSNNPVGKYAGCVAIQHNNSICPSF